MNIGNPNVLSHTILEASFLPLWQMKSKKKILLSYLVINDIGKTERLMIFSFIRYFFPGLWYLSFCCEIFSIDVDDDDTRVLMTYIHIFIRRMYNIWLSLIVFYSFSLFVFVEAKIFVSFVFSNKNQFSGMFLVCKNDYAKKCIDYIHGFFFCRWMESNL